MTFAETLKAFLKVPVNCVVGGECRHLSKLKDEWATRFELSHEHDKLELEKQVARDAEIFVQAGTDVLQDADFKRVVSRMFELKSKSEMAKGGAK